MKTSTLLLAVLVPSLGCQEPRQDFPRPFSEIEMRRIVHEEILNVIRAEPRVVTKEITEKVHRYEINMNQLKIPNENAPFTITGSAFVSGCAKEDLNKVRDWLMANVTHDCPQKIRIEGSDQMGVSIRSGED